MNDIPKQLLDINGIKSIDIRAISGVYFLVKQDAIVYVGQSENIMSRIPKHCADKDFDSVFYIEIPIPDLFRVEKEYIMMFDPKYNSTYRSEIEFNNISKNLDIKKLRPYERHYLLDPNVEIKNKIGFMHFLWNRKVWKNQGKGVQA